MSTNSIFSRSENVGIFPLAEYRKIRPNDNALSEKNMSNFILSVIDTDSFVVSNSLDTTIGRLQFVISGYLISIFNLKDIEERLVTLAKDEGIGSISDIYASITLNITDSEAPHLTGSDSEVASGVSTFSGVTFAYSEPDTAVVVETVGQDTLRTVTLHILTKPTGSTIWKIPPNSLLKLDTQSISGIDGGEIE